jgi:hypothetical protein
VRIAHPVLLQVVVVVEGEGDLQHLGEAAAGEEVVVLACFLQKDIMAIPISKIKAVARLRDEDRWPEKRPKFDGGTRWSRAACCFK